MHKPLKRNMSRESISDKISRKETLNFVSDSMPMANYVQHFESR